LLSAMGSMPLDGGAASDEAVFGRWG